MNRKLFFLIVIPLIFSLAIQSVLASGTFGYTMKGASYGTLTNRIKGSKFYLPEKAYAQSITVYLKMNGAGGIGTARCAIYYPSLSLVATTEELDVGQDFDGWATFSFSSPPLLEIGYYWLVAWGNTPVTGEFRIYKTVGDSNQQVYEIQTYTGTFPNPLGEGEFFGYYNYKMSIYCTYNPYSEGNGNGNGEENGEPDVNLTLLPSQLASAWGIDVLAAGLFMSTLLIFAFLMPIMISKKSGLILLIVGFTLASFCIAVGWLPLWIMLLVTFLVAAIYASRIKEMI